MRSTSDSGRSDERHGRRPAGGPLAQWAVAASAAVTLLMPAGLGRGPAPPHIPTAKLLGQRIMVGLRGTRADATLLHRIRKGYVGSVILFSYNIASRSQLTRLTASLQHAARQGGNPPLLIAVDQEGGQVKRLPDGPPRLSPPAMAATGDVGVATGEGRATGAFLRALGINMDLAPVVDVPASPSAFIWRQGRAFSFSASAVSRYAGAFAQGLQAAHVAATAKHFPGVGTALVDTDNRLDQLRPSGAQLAAALAPYEALIPNGLDAVMVTTAAFPAYDPTGAPAAFSARVSQGLLRDRLDFRGLAITDALGVPTGHSERAAGVLAAEAGNDVLLYTDSAPGELSALEADLAAGRLKADEALASYRRIVALKRRVAGG